MTFIRVNRPDTAKAKRIIQAIISLNGGTLEGTTRLYKAFYIAHLFHWEQNPGVLSKYPIARMPKGPGIDAGEALLDEMKSENLIQIEVRENGPYKENIYTTSGTSQLDEDEQSAVRQAIKWVTTHSAAELSQATHELSRSWIKGSNGDILDIYADTLSEDDHAKIKNDQEWSRNLVNSVFGGNDVGCPS